MPVPSRIAPRDHATRGAWAENLAAAVLTACGYACLDRRFRVPGARST